MYVCVRVCVCMCVCHRYGFLPGPVGSGMENTFIAQAYDAGDPGNRGTHKHACSIWVLIRVLLYLYFRGLGVCVGCGCSHDNAFCVFLCVPLHVCARVFVFVYL